ncbi:unnamed protein product [Meloidogyne enterolobii]|uniref:Uncharacterized protein n=1 Tax=Meloidogyne enterolobii TaxID=390850 RepID=A0ACB0Y6T8_MELEN
MPLKIIPSLRIPFLLSKCLFPHVLTWDVLYYSLERPPFLLDNIAFDSFPDVFSFADK